MSTQRIYVYTQVFGVSITGLRNLWEPKTEFQGKKQDKPSYITAVVIPKTRAHWSEEPMLAGFTAACMELHAKALPGMPLNAIEWPIKDGDIPEPGKAPVEWMKGHWFLSGSSSSPINVEIVQGGVPVPLTNRAVVKPGDIVTLAGALAVKQNNPRGVKFYANNVLFMNPGQEIAIGNGVTGAQLMEQARAQGLNITGFTPGGGGFGGGPAAPGSFGGAPGGFMPPPAQGGFGGTPSPGYAAPAQGGFGGAPAPVQPPQGGFAPPQQQYAAPPQGGFAPPSGGFQPPAGGFPAR